MSKISFKCNQYKSIHEMLICMHTTLHVCVCMHIYMCVYIYAYIYVCVCVIYTNIYICFKLVKSNVYLTLPAYLNWDQPCCNCSVTTGGWWLPYWIVQN